MYTPRSGIRARIIRGFIGNYVPKYFSEIRYKNVSVSIQKKNRSRDFEIKTPVCFEVFDVTMT